MLNIRASLRGVVLAVMIALVVAIGSGCGAHVSICESHPCASVDRAGLLKEVHDLHGRRLAYWIGDRGDNAGAIEPYAPVHLASTKNPVEDSGGSLIVHQRIRVDAGIEVDATVITYLSASDSSPFGGGRFLPIGSQRLLLRRRIDGAETVEVWGSVRRSNQAGSARDYRRIRVFVAAHLAPIDPTLWDKLSDFQKKLCDRPACQA